MIGGETLVYFLEEDTLCALLQGWPPEMQVAVCLTSQGECGLAVHHRDEVACVPDRIAALLGLRAQKLCVVPQMAGHETRAVLFSQEQQLLSLVADTPHLTGMAADYALKFRFAREQGVDVSALERASGARRGKLSRDEAVSGAMRPAEGGANRLTVEAHVQGKGDLIRLMLAPQDAAGGETTVTLEQIDGSDETGGFTLPFTALDGWSPGKAAVIDIPANLFPEALISRYRHAPHRGEATMTASGVCFAPGALNRTGVAEPAATVCRGGTRTRRRAVRSSHAAVAALFALLLVSGHFATARGNDSQSRAVGSVSDSGTDAALQLIAEMALMEAVSWRPVDRP